MLNVQIAQSLIGIITFLIAYTISVTLAGYFTAWTAFSMGDETATDEGFLSLNPFMHMDIVGTLFIMLYGFGWGKFVPINPFNIQGPARPFKIAWAFVAKSVAHLAIAFFSLVLMIALFGQKVLLLLMSGVPMAKVFPESTSYLLSVGLILQYIFVVNAILCVIAFIIYLCGLGVMIWAEKNPDYSPYTGLIMLVLPILLYYVGGAYLVNMIFAGLTYLGYCIVYCFHAR